VDADGLTVGTTGKKTLDAGIEFHIVQARIISHLIKIPGLIFGRERRAPEEYAQKMDHSRRAENLS
jgi:hypothetical protein